MTSTRFLDGLRIVSMAQNVPGPLAAARMRQAGAHVEKIEPPTGDPLKLLSRAWYDELHDGITIEQLDLKTDAGRARAMALLQDAELFMTSQRPSVLTRLGLDIDSLRVQAPDVRVLRIVGSVRDPERAGHDLTYQAQSGLLGDDMPRILAADVMASERAFAAALALLRLPGGSTMDIGLIESIEPLLASLRHGVTVPGGPLGGGAPQYRVYPAKIGRVAVAALEPHFETRLYQQLGLAPGADLAPVMLQRTDAQWDAWARERDLPISAVDDVDGAPRTARLPRSSTS